ncbi:MAG: hypothetical protein QW587_08275 [Candidatus Bathyarchaeia archaeon]
MTREGSPSPYIGDYMFQYMTDEEVSLYRAVLLRDFSGIFTEEALENMIARRLAAT